MGKVQPRAALSQHQLVPPVTATELGKSRSGLACVSAGELEPQLWLERARELEIENARLRQLLEDAA